MERKIIETINTKVIIGAVILLYVTKGWLPSFERIKRFFTIQNMIITLIIIFIINNLSTKNFNKLVDLINFKHKYFDRPLFYGLLFLFIYALLKKDNKEGVDNPDDDHKIPEYEFDRYDWSVCKQGEEIDFDCVNQPYELDDELYDIYCPIDDDGNINDLSSSDTRSKLKRYLGDNLERYKGTIDPQTNGNFITQLSTENSELRNLVKSEIVRTEPLLNPHYNSNYGGGGHSVVCESWFEEHKTAWDKFVDFIKFW